MTDVDGLVAFLKARLDEDAHWAKACPPGPWEFSNRGWQLRLTADAPNFERLAEVEQPSEGQESAFQHMAVWGPDRVLAEVDAKRRILDEHDTQHWKIGDRVHDCQWAKGWPCRTLRLLSVPYADHPDYRQEWAP